MSEPKLISPMLDNFTMGDPISEHNGVRCCPAIENASDNKYIVKIISIPATNSQLEALLLSGAYASSDEAAVYFKSLADGVVEEAKTLEKLAQLEGFYAFSDVQLLPMEDATGFDVYLLSPYKKTLAQFLRQNSMTHLSALNLALDICAALTICRRSGYLYVDLKPENIYMEPGKSSKIGDIGFVPLNSLRFASLPDRYRSAYTPPEISDAFASLNTTVDVYALGLILYQIFNDGLLPSTDGTADVTINPPAYADYELAEIILKCCDSNPENRWSDPVELGQAIVAYMQRNGAHDTPITPVVPAETEDSPIPQPEPDDEESLVISEESPALSDVTDTESLDSTDANLDTTAEDPSLAKSETVSDDLTYDEEDAEQLSFAENDETAPEQQDEEIDYAEISSEVSSMLEQADGLISHPAPDPVVAPDPIDVPIPPPIQLNEDTEPVENTDSDETQDIEDLEFGVADEDVDTAGLDLDVADEEVYSSEYEDDAFLNTPQRKVHWVRNILITIAVLSIATIGFLFYTKYYLQPIDSIILQEHENGDLTVYVSSPVDETKLNVICFDTYGNQRVMPVLDGRAEFTNLSPGSAYTIKIAIDGFHRLIGDISAAFTTPAQTNIVQFQAVTGSEDGSAILTFTIDGPDSAQWQITYSSENADENQVVFSGRMCTITGLTIGTEYKFILTPVTNINYIGTNEVTFTASKIVKANDLSITGCINGTLTASWSAPADTTVSSWTAHCYNDSGYDKTVTVNETFVSFDGVDSASAYTVEVTAAGMSVSERAFAPANSVTVSEFKADDSNNNAIKLTWNSNGFTPDSGWILLYTIDGSAPVEVRDITESEFELATKIPGAEYVFTLQTAEGVSMLGNKITLNTAQPTSFSGYGVNARQMEFKMCERPSKKNWDRHDLSSSDYTSTFEIGQKASFLVNLKQAYNTSKDLITTLYVIRDANGAFISASSTTTTWTKMWYRSYCELDIPSLPQIAGKYTISVYFNGALAHSQNFKVVE